MAPGVGQPQHFLQKSSGAKGEEEKKLGAIL